MKNFLWVFSKLALEMWLKGGAILQRISKFQLTKGIKFNILVRIKNLWDDGTISRNWKWFWERNFKVLSRNKKCGKKTIWNYDYGTSKLI